MQQKLTVNEFASQMRISVPTVYRWIREGKVEFEKIDGVLHVIVTQELIDNYASIEIDNTTQVLLKQLQQENEFLRAELKKALDQLEESRQSHNTTIQQMQQDFAEAQQRSDTIILQLTRQFEQQTVLLEDMRNRPSFWQRLKMGLVRFATPSATEQNVTEQRN